MKIIDIVKFNDGIALVVDEIPALKYEQKGSLLIGSDDSNLLFDCLYFQMPRGNEKAFAGRKFDLPLKDGGSIHCDGKWWQGREVECAKELGIELAHITIRDLAFLKDCYVFGGLSVNKNVYMQMLRDFLTENPDYEVYGYWEYEGILCGRTTKNDHPDENFQKAVRFYYAS